MEEMKETVVSSLTMVFALTIPATAGLIILSEPIIRLIFEHGAFTPRDTLATAQTLSLYAIGLFAYSANKILVPAFYALDKTRFPVIASFMAIGINIVIVTSTIDQFGHLAIALSTSCTMLINFIFLVAVLYKSLNGFSLRRLVRGLVKISLATSALTAFLYFALPVFLDWLHRSILHQGLSLFLLIFAAASIYGITLHKLQLTEFTLLTDKIRQKFTSK